MSYKRPQDLIFTLFGEYLDRLKQPVWVGSLIALLRPFGVSEGAVRTVLSRMTSKRWLVTRRSGRNSFYALGPRGRCVVEEGRARIFRPRHESGWEGTWCLVTYSVPEDVRHLRDRMRIRLSWLGFGSLGNGVWISPHDVEPKVAQIAAEMGLAGNLTCFRARQVLGGTDESLVARCWDLPAVAARYRRFLEQWGPELDGSRRRLQEGSLTDEHAFVLRFRLLHEYREFPLLDPFLPSPLLPEEWPGSQVADLFNTFHDLLLAPSDRYVSAVLAREPKVRPPHRTSPV